MNPPPQPGQSIGNNFTTGDRIGGGRYILKRLLGRGQSSEVWLAQDAKDSKSVALKFFPPAFLSDANLIERLKQDAQRFLLLKHPNIIATYDFIRDPGAVFIATEYVEGWSLASTKVDKLCSCYTVAEIKPLIHQLCDALAFAHNDLGIIHGDLKPANLLVNAQEVLKVSDFEIANLARQECSKRGLSKGLYAGLGFLSPQQVMGETVTKLDDIYSLGATIFDLLTGTPPFYKGEIFAQICSLKAPTMTARSTELDIQGDPVPPVWEDTVARCLAKTPADRPQSVGEVLELFKRTSVLRPAAPVGTPPVLATLPTPVPPAEPAPVTTTVPESVPASEAPPVEKSAVIPPLPASPLSVLAPAASTRTPIILFAIVILLLAAIAGAAALLAFHSGSGSATASHPGTNVTPAVAVSTPASPLAAPGSPGSLDPTFNPGIGANDEIFTAAVEANGDILLGGKFTAFNTEPHRAIVRLNPDGTIDSGFSHQSAGSVRAITFAHDNQIYLGGDSMLKGHPRAHILRVDDAGGVDRTFKFGLKFNLDVRSIVEQPDGHIIIGGNFNTVADKKQEHIMRLAPDGTPDEDFDANVSAAGSVSALLLQPDGKILAVGAFKAFNTARAGHIVRLNPDGTLDPQFSTGQGADNSILALALQPDGSIVIGGDFTSVNGHSYPHLARLNPDGTVDVSFNIGAGTEKNVRSLALQPDGKILIVGDFTTYQNEPCHRIARLNPDGSLDTTFNPGNGPNGPVDTIVLQADGKILLGGTFNTYDGSNCGSVVRLNNPIPKH